jgi:CelD/BcsL family acetyltransferase involved in cellulose biosynthesis
LRGFIAIEILIEEDPVVIRNIRQEWLALVTESYACWIYSTPQWAEAWLDAFKDCYKFGLALAYDGKELIGILPFYLESKDWKFLFSRKLIPINSTMADYFSPIIKKGLEHETTIGLINKVIRHFKKKGVIIFPHIPVDHPCFPIIKNYFRDNDVSWVEVPSICHRLNFLETYEATEKSFKASHRGDIRRQKRRMRKMGKLSLVKITDSSTAKRYFDEFTHVYEEKWKATGYRSIFQNNKIVRKFYVSLIDNIINDYLHFSLLKIDEEVISYHFGFQFGKWLYWYKPTYKLKYQNLSPSKVHLSMLVEDGINNGLTGLDLLSGNEEYKSQWANEQYRKMTFIGAFNRTNIGYHFNTKGKIWLKRWRK